MSDSVVVLVDTKWVAAVNEFLSDWIKGDFDLPELAAIDAEAILVAGADGKQPVLVGKVISAGK
jgi:hypothetical protein